MLPPFQRFYEAHRAEVHRFLVGMVGRSEADDCFQETFLAALAAYPRLRDGSNLRGWVLTIAYRKALDALRAASRRPPVPRAEVVPPPQLPDADLQAAVAALPPKQRAAVVLRVAQDLGYGEVAAAIGCTPEAARRNVHEGLKRLREVLG